MKSTGRQLSKHWAQLFETTFLIIFPYPLSLSVELPDLLSVTQINYNTSILWLSYRQALLLLACDFHGENNLKFFFNLWLNKYNARSNNSSIWIEISRQSFWQLWIYYTGYKLSFMQHSALADVGRLPKWFKIYFSNREFVCLHSGVNQNGFAGANFTCTRIIDPLG